MREMKDSGIEWIGEIPQEWNIARLRDIKAEKKYAIVDGPFGSAISTNDYKESGIPLIRITNLKNGEVTENDMVYISEELAEKVGRSSIGLSDIVFAKTGATIGKCGVNKTIKYGILASSCVKISISHDFDHRFFYYIFLTDQFNEALKNTCTGTTRDTINLSPFSKLNVVIPPYKSQHRIADYLDRKCSQIDAIIARQQEVIEKLKAYKLSVITEAVTKGLNPDVPMKDSGVEWIGEIPEHWKMVRLKFLLSHIIDCPHETPIYSADGDYLVIRTADQDLGKLRTDEDMYRLDEGEYQNRIRRMPLEKDDIVYGREGERWGLACLVPESNKYCLGQRMLQFRCKRELFLPRFAMWALNSKFVYLQGAVDTIGSTSPHVNISTVRNFLIPVLPISEQQEIAEYIDKKMSQLDKEIEHRENLICKLNDYKKSLIYEVVTGKQEV